MPRRSTASAPHAEHTAPFPNRFLPDSTRSRSTTVGAAPDTASTNIQVLRSTLVWPLLGLQVKPPPEQPPPTHGFVFELLKPGRFTDGSRTVLLRTPPPHTTHIRSMASLRHARTRAGCVRHAVARGHAPFTHTTRTHAARSCLLQFKRFSLLLVVLFVFTCETAPRAACHARCLAPVLSLNVQTAAVPFHCLTNLPPTQPAAVYHYAGACTREKAGAGNCVRARAVYTLTRYTLFTTFTHIYVIWNPCRTFTVRSLLHGRWWFTRSHAYLLDSSTVEPRLLPHVPPQTTFTVGRAWIVARFRCFATAFLSR